MTDKGYLPHYPDGDCIIEGPNDYCFGAGKLTHTILFHKLKRLAGLLRLVEQEQLTAPEHLIASPVFSGVRVTRSVVLCICL